MTKREAEQYARLSATMDRLGISRDDFAALMRIEKTLHRWAERECNGEVETADDGKAFITFEGRGCYRTPNRERGALKRLTTIMARYPKLAAYQQGDPRGCALYVYERAKLDAANDRFGGDKLGIDSMYSSIGVAVCL